MFDQKKANTSFFILVGVMLSLAMTSIAAEVFKYVDKRGHIYLTDSPMKGQVRLVWRSGSDQRSRNGAASVKLKKFRQNKARFAPLIETVATRTRLHPNLLHAVVRAESAYDPVAVSSAGAVGLMQLMPETAKRYGVTNRRDPEANLNAGARYLSDLIKLFEYDLALALAAYNAGENAVKEYGNRIPPYPETQSYVSKVLKFYRES